MRSLSLVFVVLVGCGGENFTTAFSNAPDGSGPVGTSETSVVEDGSTGGSPATGGAAGAKSRLEFDSGRSTGGMRETGGASTGGERETGGASTGGVVQTGGAAATGGAPATGGVSATGGATATGGVTVDACALVTHDNGTGQTWTDCVPLDTYDLSEAMRACKASGADRCIEDTHSCGAGNFVVIGRDSSDQIVGAWGYGGSEQGFACSAPTCSGCPSSGMTWG